MLQLRPLKCYGLEYCHCIVKFSFYCTVKAPSLFPYIVLCDHSRKQMRELCRGLCAEHGFDFYIIQTVMHIDLSLSLYIYIYIYIYHIYTHIYYVCIRVCIYIYIYIYIYTHIFVPRPLRRARLRLHAALEAQPEQQKERVEVR